MGTTSLSLTPKAASPQPSALETKRKRKKGFGSVRGNVTYNTLKHVGMCRPWGGASSHPAWIWHCCRWAASSTAHGWRGPSCTSTWCQRAGRWGWAHKDRLHKESLHRSSQNIQVPRQETNQNRTLCDPPWLGQKARLLSDPVSLCYLSVFLRQP